MCLNNRVSTLPIFEILVPQPSRYKYDLNNPLLNKETKKIEDLRKEPNTEEGSRSFSRRIVEVYRERETLEKKEIVCRRLKKRLKERWRSIPGNINVLWVVYWVLLEE